MTRQRREPGQNFSIDNQSGFNAAAIKTMAEQQSHATRISGHDQDRSSARTAAAMTARAGELYNTGYIPSQVTAGPRNGMAPTGLQHMLPQPRPEPDPLDDDGA
jgi:hypothetical protein